MIKIEKTDIFHVHSRRCRHAENVPDEAHVKKAIALGATGIWFSDHSPFPGNPFEERMDIEELSEYLKTLHELKGKYAGIINIYAGLEIEYLPSFRNYYEELKENPLMDFMMIGQHMYEVCPGTYSFQLSSAEKNEREYVGCGEAIVEGIESGLFDVIAHPDRIYKRRKEWMREMATLGQKIIQTASDMGVLVEKNLASMRRKRNFREEFWEMVPKDMEIIIGADAHSLKELEDQWSLQLLYYCDEMNETGR